MNIFHAKFSTSQITEATGVNNDTLQNWLKRQLIIGQKDIVGGGSQGRHRQYSFFNLIEIAAAKALVDAGMGDLKSAFKAANMFAHTGGGPLGGTPERVPGCPFNKCPGITLLVAGPGWSDEVFMAPNDSALKLYTDLVFKAPAGREGCIFVNMSDVFDRVVVRVGYRPVEVLGIAYPKGATA
ncbi:MerR family transcriptional regulator [Paenirhodobacter populi]|uniref:MerR family transcriptional regulator n=1 Tax=Paenirhodobacter populi TaxID=2306993 RepID=A0A443JJX1_9RHOB|nr:MerR family transcriptional regulator [Sinirhodobacter populi]RWR20820.1 MerR family transcriptional regulator [Sinirhodobacter populi]